MGVEGVTAPSTAPDLSLLPADLQERWPLAAERASRKLAGLSENPAAWRLVQAAQRAPNARQRVVWLQRAADAWAAPMRAVAACKAGCSHCCHTPVTITRLEADLIGRATGRTPASPARSVRLDDHETLAAAIEAQAELQEPGWPGPCPFLADGRCSVYAARPMACRLLLNLDDDDLLCRLIEGTPVPVPYANAGQLRAVYLLAQPGAELADIRAFFP